MTYQEGGETMKKITKIEGNKVASIIKPKLRVAAYCRVSTGSDEQLVRNGNWQVFLQMTASQVQIPRSVKSSTA